MDYIWFFQKKNQKGLFYTVYRDYVIKIYVYNNVWDKYDLIK